MGAAAVAALVVVLVIVFAGDDAEDVVTGDRTTTTEAEPTTTTEDETTTTVAGDAERVIVAVDAQGRVVTLDPESGETRDVLLEDIPVDDPAKNDIAVTPSGDAAYVVRPSETETDPTIVHVPLDGGDPADVAQGLAPAVSPDGERLAYVAFEGEGVDAEPRIVVRQLADGSEREIAPGTEQPFVFISDLAWTDGGEETAFIAGEVQTGGWIVEADAADLDDARRLGPTAREEGSYWVAVSAFGERLAISEFCCDVPPERFLLLAVSTDPIEVEGGLLEDEYQISHVDDDSDGDALVFVAEVGPNRGTLYRWDGEGEAERLADGIVAAAW